MIYIYTYVHVPVEIATTPFPALFFHSPVKRGEPGARDLFDIQILRVQFIEVHNPMFKCNYVQLRSERVS